MYTDDGWIATSSRGDYISSYTYVITTVFLEKTQQNVHLVGNARARMPVVMCGSVDLGLHSADESVSTDGLHGY